MIPIILAVTISLSSPPTSLNYQQDSEVNINLNCSSCGNSYLRAVFFKDGTTGYFGYTKDNNGNWVNTTADKTLYFPILKTDLVEGSWSGKLSFKPDYESNYFAGAGDYRFKVGRYTSADSSALWSDSFPIILLAPTSVPTLYPSVVPSKPRDVGGPTHTPKPANTSTPKAQPTRLEPTISRINSRAPTPKPQVLSVTDELPTDTPATPSSTPAITSNSSQRPKNPLPSVLLITIGLSLIGFAMYKFF